MGFLRNFVDGFSDRRVGYAAYDVGQAMAKEGIDPRTLSPGDIEKILEKHKITLKYEDQSDYIHFMAVGGYECYFDPDYDPNSDGSTLRERSGC